MLAPEVVELCRELAALLPPQLQKVILLNTGSEANEAAIRMAKLATGGHEVVGLTASFHGLTGGAGAATYSVGRRGYGPAIPGSIAIPAPNAYRCPIRHCDDACDLSCLEVGFELIDAQRAGQPAAAIAEPILSTGGVIVPPPGYFPRLKELCEARGMLLILDEAQTAFGRVGANFAFEQDGVVPDFLAVSKTLGGGIPLAAAVTSAAIEETCYERGFVHVTSHVSDPLPAAVGLAVLEVLRREHLAERALALGARLEAGLRDLHQRYEVIGDVRGRGLLWGVELVRDRQSRRPASRARRQDHPALPGARPVDEHRLAARARERVADRAAAHRDRGRDRRRPLDPRSGDPRVRLKQPGRARTAACRCGATGGARALVSSVSPRPLRGLAMTREEVGKAPSDVERRVAQALSWPPSQTCGPRSQRGRTCSASCHCERPIGSENPGRAGLWIATSACGLAMTRAGDQAKRRCRCRRAGA